MATKKKAIDLYVVSDCGGKVLYSGECGVSLRDAKAAALEIADDESSTATIYKLVPVLRAKPQPALFEVIK